MSKELERYSSDQMALITNSIAKGATQDELKLFLYQCERTGLDPLSKQIYFVKYGAGPGSIIVGIDGFRLIAHRTGKLSGIKRGPIFNDGGELVGGWAEVYRSDWTAPAREEAPLREYTTNKGQWLKMPETMIKKVAEAAALRMAFPSDLSGLYSSEEMDQASEPPRTNDFKDVTPPVAEQQQQSSRKAEKPAQSSSQADFPMCCGQKMNQSKFNENELYCYKCKKKLPKKPSTVHEELPPYLTDDIPY